MRRVTLYPEQFEALARERNAGLAAPDAGPPRPGDLPPTLEEHHAARDEADFHRTRELELEAAHQLRQLAEGVRRQRGFASASALDEARRAADQLRLDLMRDAPTRAAREVLGQNFDHRMQIFDHDLSSHVEKEKLGARLDLSRQRQALAEQDAINAQTPLAFDTHAQTATNEIDEQARLTGVDAGAVEAARARMLGSIYAARISDKIERGDLEGADAERAACEQILPPFQLDAIDRLMAAPSAYDPMRTPWDHEAIQGVSTTSSKERGPNPFYPINGLDFRSTALSNTDVRGSGQSATGTSNYRTQLNPPPQRFKRTPAQPRITKGTKVPDFPPPPPPIPGRPEGSGKFRGDGAPTDKDRKFYEKMEGQAAWGEIAHYDNAARHLRHFLDASGAPLSLDMRSLLSDGGVQVKMWKQYDSALALAINQIKKENLARGAFQITTPWALTTPRTQDWGHATGDFSLSISAVVKYKRDKDGKYEFSIVPVVNAFDRYNWEPGKGTIDVDVKDVDMARLHRVGLGQDFDMTGRYELAHRSYLFDPSSGNNKIMSTTPVRGSKSYTRLTKF